MRLDVCRCKNISTLPTHALINVVVCNEPLIRQAGGFRNTLNETFRANEGFFVANFSSRDMKGEGIWNESFTIVSRYIRRKTRRTFAFVLFVTIASMLLLQAFWRGLQSHWNDVPVPVLWTTTIDTKPLPRKLHTLTLPNDSSFPLKITEQLNPTWTLKTYDAYGGAEYMETNCEKYSRAYRALKPLAFKADLLRYCILYTEGGAWMDDDILLVKSLDELTNDMRHDALFVYDRRVYKLAGGPKQVWNAFMVAVPGLDVFARAMEKIAENVADRRHFYHSLYYTGPALLYESIADGDSIEFRWRVQHRDALSAASRRVADVRTDEEVLLHFKLPRATKHYSEMSRGGDIYAS